MFFRRFRKCGTSDPIQHAFEALRAFRCPTYPRQQFVVGFVQQFLKIRHQSLVKLVINRVNEPFKQNAEFQRAPGATPHFQTLPPNGRAVARRVPTGVRSLFAHSKSRGSAVVDLISSIESSAVTLKIFTWEISAW